jgi:hypothetical protein
VNWLPFELSEYRDPVTGHRVVRWTSSPTKDQHLYFTSPSVTADNRWLVFISERGGQPNVCALERSSGRIRPLTRNTRGLRLSYCYPWGGPTGLSKGTPCLDPVRRRAFAVIDGQVWRCDVDAGMAEVLAALPEPGITSFTHVSADGRWLCVPVTAPADPFHEPAATQGEQMERVWPWVAAGKVHTNLWLFDTETGATRLWAKLPFWVTHVQFDPTGGYNGICNSEGLWYHQQHLPRMWCLSDSGVARPLYAQAADEQCGHEIFDHAGNVVYHGHRGKEAYLVRRAQTGELLDRIQVDDLTVHHAIPGDGKAYLVDCQDGLIYRVDNPKGVRRVTPLCRHDSGNWEQQDNHVHPVATGHGSVVFTSRRAGAPDVYEVFFNETNPRTAT